MSDISQNLILLNCAKPVKEHNVINQNLTRNNYCTKQCSFKLIYYPYQISVRRAKFFDPKLKIVTPNKSLHIHHINPTYNKQNDIYTYSHQASNGEHFSNSQRQIRQNSQSLFREALEQHFSGGLFPARFVLRITF